LLRKSIRKLVIKETKLLDSIATAQMEQVIQERVVETTKRLSDQISKETGVESSLQQEDIERYCKQVLAEIKRK
jgi:ribosomal protein L22